MGDDAAPPRLPAWFFAALAALALFFLALGIVRADRTSLRGDECAGILQSRSDPGPLDLLLRGKPGQISPAPLYYLVHQAAHAARGPLGYLGLGPSGYYRLPVLLLSAGLGAAAAAVVALRLRRERSGPLPLILVLCALAVLWFQPKSFAFAGMARPYGLWNGLWFLALALLLCRPDPGIAAGVVLSLLAATATGACFQILALGAALLVVRRVERRPLEEVLREGVRLLAAPALIGAYYALRSPAIDMDDREPMDAATDFLRFWLITNLPAWIAGALACGLTLSRPKLRAYALPAAAFAALVLIMPLIFVLARSKGYSSPSRQYLWSTSGLPLLLLIAALAWPELRAKRLIAGAAVLLAAGFLGHTAWKPARRNDTRDLACLRSGGDLRALLRTERPAILTLDPGVKHVERCNVFFIAEWIDEAHAARPRGGRHVHFTDAQGRLEARLGDAAGQRLVLPVDLPQLYSLDER